MKPNRFTLTIDLGNDAMRARRHVARALADLAKKMPHEDRTDGKILDENGNSVGRWEFNE